MMVHVVNLAKCAVGKIGAAARMHLHFVVKIFAVPSHLNAAYLGK